jgi:hypothetical protein
VLSELTIEAPELQLDGVFTCVAAPVQAEGTVASKSFYFRSRHDAWSFAIALTANVDPVDIDRPEKGFLRQANYGVGSSDASYMPLEDARRIIIDCAREFLGQSPT